MSLWSKSRRTEDAARTKERGGAPVSQAEVLEALRPIVDPDFGRSIVDLGFVKNIAIDGPRSPRKPRPA